MTSQQITESGVNENGDWPLASICGQALETGYFLQLAVAITAALEELHQHNITHHNINPHTILVSTETSAVTLTGFSASQLQAQEHIGGGNLAGAGIRPAYMSPEQTGRMNRTVDYRTDLYSLGVTFYQMLTGVLPCRANDALQWVHCHIARSPRPPKELIAAIPPILSDIVMKLLAKNAEERYQTASGLKLDLERCLDQWESNHAIEAFSLGEGDVPDRLPIPQMFYGRKKEIDTLVEAFNRAAERGTCEFVMIEGYSGIGKTSLVRELFKPTIGERGFFVSGKFDQLKRNIPYATAAELFRELNRKILSESEERIAQWRQQIQEALGANGQIVFEVIPELELIIGPQPPVPQLSPKEAQNRFNMVFRQFIGVFAKREHPLVLFLDDLQWVDTATLKLFEYILTHINTKYFLCIGAYRDNEVSPSHPLMSMLDVIRKSHLKVTTITLSPLSLDELGQFMAKTFHTDQRRVEVLSELVHKKTGGNPFFIIQFLMALRDEGLVEFDRVEQHWKWDIDRIRAKGYTDNVVDLMTGKLRKLPPKTIQAMRFAACIGSGFDLKSLAVISGASEEETLNAVGEAVKEGLLVRSEGGYSFLHDRVQEVAYSLVPVEQRAGLHLRIGRLLLSRFSEEELDERVFDVVNQLNRGAHLITDPGEKEFLRQMNSVAGRKAKTAVAYASALAYLTRATALLPPTAWSAHYEETLALYLDRSECEYLVGNFEQADELFRLLLGSVRSDLDRARVYRLQSRLYQMTGHFDEGLTLILEALRLLGVALPDSDEALLELAEVEMSEIRAKLFRLHIADLADVPRASDPLGAMIIALLADGLIPAYAARPPYFPLLAAKAVSYSLYYGNTLDSCTAYICYAIVLISLSGDIPTAFEFSEMSLSLVEKFDDLRARGQVLGGHGGLIVPWRKHFAKSLPFLEQSFDALRNSGDFLDCSNVALLTVWTTVETGAPLEEVMKVARKYLTLAREMHNEIMYDTIRLSEQMVASLKGKTREPAGFDDDSFSEADCLSRFTQASWHSGLAYYYVMKLTAASIFGFHKEALELARHAEPVLRHMMAMPIAGTLCYYQALALVALYPQSDLEQKREFSLALEKILRKLDNWAKNCPQNFENRYALVSAEVARILGRELEAERFYEHAIRSAHENGFLQNEGLAYELASKFYDERGFKRLADTYLRYARSCYSRWGAEGKVKQLDEQYPWLQEEDHFVSAITDRVDAITVVEASQAISEEILLPNLINTLMRIVIENAGAQKVDLLLVRGDDLKVEAQGVMEGEEIKTLFPGPAQLSELIPLSIVNYVRRTRQSVILDDARDANVFFSDEYIVRNKPVSVLCLPLLRQADMIGVLYVENNLVKGAFTPGRIAVLEVLAAQAAIALENSTLFTALQKYREHLEVLVKDRTAELEQANIRLQELDSLKSMFLASMSHELRTPLNSIIGFTGIMLQGLVGPLNDEQRFQLGMIKSSGRHLLDLINDILDLSKIEAGQVELRPEPFDMGALIDKTVQTLQPFAEKKKLKLIVKTDPGVGLVFSDRRRVEQILINLINNAIKFTEYGKVYVQCRIHDGWLVTSVTDTGIGIKPEEMKNLFTTFRQLDSTLTRKYEGTGLGLAICRKLVTILGGEIGVESAWGIGSTFTFRLPLDRQEE